MTGRSSKSYKHRSGTGYIIILWQNLGSAAHVTLGRVTLSATALVAGKRRDTSIRNKIEDDDVKAD